MDDNQPGPGHNNPPEDPPVTTPFDIAVATTEALYIEAKAWLDGEKIASAEQERAVTLLMDLLRSSAKNTEALRVEEKRPHDEAAYKVQLKFKPLSDKTGRAIDGCKNVLAVWRKKVADDLAAEAERRRLEADKLRMEAELALANSRVDDIERREIAEQAVDTAKMAEKSAKKAERTATTGRGLRSTWTAKITDAREFARYCWVHHEDRIRQMLETCAIDEVRLGRRDGVPGLEFIEERTAI